MTCKANGWAGRGTAFPDCGHGEKCELRDVNGDARCPWHLFLGQRTLGGCFGAMGAGCPLQLPRGTSLLVPLLLGARLDNDMCFGGAWALPKDLPPNPARIETASSARMGTHHICLHSQPPGIPLPLQTPTLPPHAPAATLLSQAGASPLQGPWDTAQAGLCSPQLGDLTSALWEGGSSPEWLGGPGHLLAPPGQAAHLCLQWPVAVAAEDGHAAGTGMLLPPSPLAASEPADPACSLPASFCTLLGCAGLPLLTQPKQPGAIFRRQPAKNSPGRRCNLRGEAIKGSQGL